MRIFILILAIILLPLRSWVGDAMAVSMVTQHLAASAVSAQAADAQPGPTIATAMPADCPMHAQSSPGAGIESWGVCTSCDACTLCLALVAGSQPGNQLLTWLPHAPRAGPAVSFASVALAPAIKPPIS